MSVKSITNRTIRRQGSNDPASQLRRSHLQIQPTNSSPRQQFLMRRSHTRDHSPPTHTPHTPFFPLVTLTLASDHECDNFNTRQQMTHGWHYKPPGVHQVRSSRVDSIWLQHAGLLDRGGDHTTVKSHTSIHT